MPKGKSAPRKALFSLLLTLAAAVAGAAPAADGQARPPAATASAASRNGIDDQALARLGTLTMTEAQQDRLFELMAEQAPARRIKRRTARKALAALQRLALTDPYDPAAAGRLAQDYSHALAELTLLDVQLASRFRQTLTPQQRKLLENAIEQRWEENAASAGHDL